MLSDFTGADRVYIACGYTDLRRGIDGLAAMVQQQFHLDPFTNTLFLFCGRRRDRIKALYWEGNGFVLLYKRLESGSFQWPRKESETRVLTPQQYRWLMEGLSVDQPKAHKPVKEKNIISGSFATPEAISHIMVQKFVMGSPLYRQEQELDRQGIQLSRQTMSNWILRVAEDYLTPVYKQLHKELLKREVLHADETTLQVLHEPGKKPQSDSYMWLYRTSGDTDKPIVLYEYQPGRGAKHPEAFLAGFGGYLHTDGYAGYHNLPGGITVVGCWAHARRKFDEAVKSLPKGKAKGSSASQGLAYCNLLFEIERGLAEKTTEERYEERQKQAKSVLDAMFAWANTRTAAPKSALGKAFTYLKEQWPYLTNYLKDGRLEISNNRAERSIKPFVIDRKNFLFANTPKGATGSAVMFSMIQTAEQAVHNLLPWTAPAECCVK